MGKGCVFPIVQNCVVRTTFAPSFFTAKQVDDVLDFIMLTKEATRTSIWSWHLPKCYILKEVYCNLINVSKLHIKFQYTMHVFSLICVSLNVMGKFVRF